MDNKFNSNKKIEDVFFAPKRKAVHLREKVWRLELKNRDLKQFFKNTWSRFIFVAVVFIFIVSFFSYLLVTQAEVANFYPTSCLGGWQNPQNAQGRPDVGENSLAEEFNENNSAVLKNVISQIFCGNFQGDTLQDYQPQKAVVKFSWLIKPEIEAINILNTAATSTLIQIIKTTNNEATSTFIEIISPEEVAPVEETSSSPPASFWQKIVNFAFAEESSFGTLIEENSIIQEVSTSSLIEPLPRFSSESKISTSTIEEALVATSTGQELLAAAAPKIFEPEPFFEILYTLDGASWQSLGKVNLDNWQNLEFEIPNFNWEDISKFQINIQSLSPVDFIPTVYLDNLRLEVEYETQKLMAVLIENIMPANNETALPDEKGMKINDLSSLENRLFNIPINSKIFPGECLKTSYILNDTNKNIYVYKESDMSSAYRDFGVVEQMAVISIGFGENGENICPLSLYEQGLFRFLEVDDPERIVCADNISYEECKSKSTGKETIWEIK